MTCYVEILKRIDVCLRCRYLRVYLVDRYYIVCSVCGYGWYFYEPQY